MILIWRNLPLPTVKEVLLVGGDTEVSCFQWRLFVVYYMLINHKGVLRCFIKLGL